MDRKELDELRSVDELEAYQGEVRARLTELNTEFAGLPFPDGQRGEYGELTAVDKEISRRCRELRARERHADQIGRNEANREGGTAEWERELESESRSRASDPYDLSNIRVDLLNPEAGIRVLRDRAMRAVEMATFPHEGADREDVQNVLAALLDRDATDGLGRGSVPGTLARHVLATGSAQYKSAFGKYIAGKSLGPEEMRALSLTGSAGGFAVPFVLDPTIIPTSNLAVNPFRSISRVEQITVDEWRGVSSAGVTAAYAAEVTEASDNAPTLAQPTVSTEKAQAFIPFSIEIGMDWGGLQAEMARLLQDAKDELEASKFAVGSGTNEPFGVITGATTTVTSATGGAFVVADLYTVEAQLGARFRPAASAVMNRAIAQKIRQFDTAGGASLWIDNLRVGLDNQVPAPGNYGARVLGYGAYESSAMASTVTTGSKIIVLGDFKYYLIADRVGLSVELIPHMFATANNLPSGQRGLYAYWRNGAKVLHANAFRVLQL